MNGSKVYSIVLYYSLPVVMSCVWAVVKMTVLKTRIEDHFVIVIPLAMCVMAIANIFSYVVLSNYIRTKNYADKTLYIVVESLVFVLFFIHIDSDSLFETLLLDFGITTILMVLVSVMIDAVSIFIESSSSVKTKKLLLLKKGDREESHNRFKIFVRGIISSYLLPLVWYFIHTLAFILVDGRVTVFFPGWYPLEYMFISVINIAIFVVVCKFKKHRYSLALMILESLLFYLFTIPLVIFVI